MTTQQRLDCLLKHLDSLAETQGQGVALNENDVELLKRQCGFRNHHEIAFYIRSLGERRLVIDGCAGDDTILQARITIDGYCYLDKLEDESGSVTGKFVV
ncbi:MAG: hypothetical protein OXQ84_04255 [bacterium]|nr:hypothetical protein [bacterium]